MRAGACAFALLALVVAGRADNARAEERKKATQAEVDAAMDRINKQQGITTDGPRVGPGTSARDLAARWADALSAGNQKGLLSLIAGEWWASCKTPEARAAESDRQMAVARSLGGLAVDVPRGAKLTKAESLSPEKRVAKGGELDGCVADHEVIVQRWEFTVRKGKGEARVQAYEVIGVDGKWVLRGL